MSDGFKISKDLTLPKTIAKQVTSIVGKRESGKTYNGGVLAEELVKGEIPIVVIDPMGIWWGLQVAVKYVNGKQVPNPDKPGLPIVVFGGDHANIPLPMMRGQRIPLVPDPEKIKLMATSIVESGINAVIDTSALPSQSQVQAVITEFIPALQHANRDYGVRTVLIEEAEVVAPQSPMRDEVLCLHVMNNLVKRGGNWNLGCVLMTQRAASINKNLLTQSDILMIGRLSAPQDKAAIQDWVKKATETDASKKELDKWYDSLNELNKGEMYVWKPDPPKINRVKVQFRLRETLHATREFLESPEVRKVKPLNVDEYVERFKNKFEPPKPKTVLEPPKLTPIIQPTVRSVPAPTPRDLSREAALIKTVQKETGTGQAVFSGPENSGEVPVAELTVRRPVAGLETRKPALPASDRDALGRVLYAISQGAFDERQTLPKTVEILSQFGWNHQRREVEEVLLQLCDLKFFTRKISSGNMFWYWLAGDAKQRIILLEVNAA